ncbi:MAG: hypothetical protein ACPIOQ_18870, partial [Promethearchaeia archaeon]
GSSSGSVDGRTSAIASSMSFCDVITPTRQSKRPYESCHWSPPDLICSPRPFHNLAGNRARRAFYPRPSSGDFFNC